MNFSHPRPQTLSSPILIQPTLSRPMSLTPQLRDRSITINHNGTLLTWIPRDQLVPPSTRYTDITPGVPPSPNPPPKKRSKNRTFPRPNQALTIMQRLKQVLWLFKPKPTKVIVTGARSPRTLTRKPSFWDLWGRGQASKSTRTRCRAGSSSSKTSIPKALSRLACPDCKARAVKDERVSCFNYLCRGCGERAVSVVRGDRGFCEEYASQKEREHREEVLNPLAGPSVWREVEILRRVEGEVEASSGSISSTDAVVGVGEGHSHTGPKRQGLVNVQKESMGEARRKCRKLKFKKLCINQECGDLVVDGDGTTAKTSSEDSLVLVSVDQEPEYEPAVFKAAQIGSPAGLAHSTWPSPHLRALTRAKAEVGITILNSQSQEQPILYLRRGTNLPSLLEEAMSSPMYSPKIVTGAIVSPNSPKDQALPSAAKSRPISILGRSLAYQDQIGDLDTPPPAHSEVYHESVPSTNWMDLLDHPSSLPSPTHIMSLPRSLLVEPPRSSPDSNFSIPKSLVDSEFCNELVLSTIPERTERAREAPKLTHPPTYPYQSHFPNALKKMRNCRDSLDSNTSSIPVFLSCDQHRANLTCNHASTSIPTLTSFPRPSSSPTPTASPNSDRPSSSLLFDSTYFDEDRHLQPYPHTRRTPSPPLTPYPSLSSSVTTLEFGFRSALAGVNLAKTIHPQGYTPPPQDHSPRLVEWGNETVSIRSDA